MAEYKKVSEGVHVVWITKDDTIGDIEDELVRIRVRCRLSAFDSHDWPGIKDGREGTIGLVFKEMEK